MPEMKIFVPKPGLLVRDPATMRPLPPEGAAKPMNTYWRRRLMDGDVSLAIAPAPEPPAEIGG